MNTSICEHLFAGIRGCYERAGDTPHLRLHGDFHPGNVLVDDDIVHIVSVGVVQAGARREVRGAGGELPQLAAVTAPR